MENDNVRDGVGIMGLKKNRFRDSLLLLSFQWKDLEDHYEAMHHTIERRADELRVREEAVKNGLRDVETRVRLFEVKRSELDLLWEAMDAKLRGLEEFGSKCRLVVEGGKRAVKETVEEAESIVTRAEEITVKTKEFESASGEVMESIKAKFKEIEAKEKELKWKEKEMARQNKKVFEFAVGVKRDKETVNEAFKSLVLREKQFEDRTREFELRNLEFDSDREKVNEFARQLEVKDLEITEKLKEIESRNKDVEWIKQRYEADKKKMDGHINGGNPKLELEKQKLDDIRKEIELSKRGFEIQPEQGKEEIEWKGKKSEKLSKDHQDCNDSSCLIINGPTLQFFLNECWKDQEKIGFAVWVLLRLSPDPAKLALDAVESFFPPHLTKGGAEFSGGIVRRSCIFLLEQLMRMSPNVNPIVKTEARRLSFNWITKVKGDAEHTSEILGFLLLLAVYDLGSTFDLDELFNYVKIVAHCRQVPHICRLLGMADKIRGLIQDLIGQKKQIVAIRYIMEFNLVKQFSPDLLLKDHMEKSMIIFNTDIKNGNHSLDAQMHAIDKRISDLKDVIRCIDIYKIGSSFSLASLRLVIASLEKKKTELGQEPVHRVESTILRCNRIGIAKADSSPTTSPWKASPYGVDTSPSVQSVEMDCHHQGDLCFQDPVPKKEDHFEDKDTSLDISVKLEGWESLDTSPNPSNSTQLKVAKTLQALSNPAKYVLVAVEEFLRSKKNGDEILLLLKELKKFSFKIDPQTNVESRKLSAAWKSNLALKNPDLMNVTCFLLFLDIYGLITSFGADQVLHLFDPKQLREYLEQIGMPEFLPDLVRKLINTYNRIKAIRYIHAFNFRESFPIVPLIDEHLQYWKNQAEEICKVPNTKHHFQMSAINKRLAAIRSAIKLIKECKLETEYPIKGLEKAVADLMLQKIEKQHKNQLSGQNSIKSFEAVSTTIKDPEAVDTPSGQKRKTLEPITPMAMASSSSLLSTQTSSRNFKNQKEAWRNKRLKKFRRGNFLHEHRFDGRFGCFSNHG